MVPEASTGLPDQLAQDVGPPSCRHAQSYDGKQIVSEREYEGELTLPELALADFAGLCLWRYRLVAPPRLPVGRGPVKGRSLRSALDGVAGGNIIAGAKR